MQSMQYLREKRLHRTTQNAIISSHLNITYRFKLKVMNLKLQGLSWGEN